MVVYERGHKLSKASASAQTFDALAVGPQGRLYLADTAANQVRTLSPTGQALGAFSVPHPASLAPLSDGNLVVAAASGKLLYAHSPAGIPIKSFGELKRFDAGNVEQNHFLNRGEVVVGPSDTIYYVSKFAPTPTVQKFSREGQLLSEFAVKGGAIDYQSDVAKRFLREKGPDVVGGFYVITSAAVDPATGHLWIGMNGTTRDGVVYEYNSRGEKLREYALLLESPTSSSGLLTGVKGITVRTPWIYVLTWENEVYRFNVNQRGPGISAVSRPGAGQRGGAAGRPGPPGVAHEHVLDADGRARASPTALPAAATLNLRGLVPHGQQPDDPGLRGGDQDPDDTKRHNHRRQLQQLRWARAQL